MKLVNKTNIFVLLITMLLLVGSVSVYGVVVDEVGGFAGESDDKGSSGRSSGGDFSRAINNNPILKAFSNNEFSEGTIRQSSAILLRASFFIFIFAVVWGAGKTSDKLKFLNKQSSMVIAIILGIFSSFYLAPSTIYRIYALAFWGVFVTLIFIGINILLSKAGALKNLFLGLILIGAGLAMWQCTSKPFFPLKIPYEILGSGFWANLIYWIVGLILIIMGLINIINMFGFSDKLAQIPKVGKVFGHEKQQTARLFDNVNTLKNRSRNLNSYEDARRTKQQAEHLKDNINTIRTNINKSKLNQGGIF